MAVQFGVILPNFGPSATAESIASVAREAEAAGFDSVWTTDHLLLPVEDAARFGTLFEAITTLAYLAGITKRVRLGVSSLVLPMRHPIVVAKQMAALDALSGGRAMLCVSSGWSEGEFANLGVFFAGRGLRLEESVAVLRLLWGGDAARPVENPSGPFAFRKSVFSPPPAQGGGPPLWIGGNSAVAVRRAARLADGWHGTNLAPGDFGVRVGWIRSQAIERPFVVSVRLRLSFDPQADHPLRGEPRAMARILKEYARAGLEYLAVDFLPHGPGDPAAERIGMLRRFMDEVLPLLPEGG